MEMDPILPKYIATISTLFDIFMLWYNYILRSIYSRYLYSVIITINSVFINSRDANIPEQG